MSSGLPSKQADLEFFGFGSQIEFWQQDIEEWLIAHTHNSSLLNSNLVMFACILWWLWRARNEEVLGHSKINNHSLICRINALFHTCNSVFILDSQISSKEIRWVSWKKPDVGTFKINANGSSLNNTGRAGFGGVARDHLGH